MVRWLRLHALTAKGPGSVPGLGAKIPKASRRGPKTNKQTNKKNPIKFFEWLRGILGTISEHKATYV